MARRLDETIEDIGHDTEQDIGGEPISSAPSEPVSESVFEPLLPPLRDESERAKELARGLAERRLDLLHRVFRPALEEEIRKTAELLGEGDGVQESKGEILTGEELQRQLEASPRADQLLQGWLVKGAVTLLVAKTGSAKTCMAHRLAWNLSQGQPFLGMYPPYPLRILYVDQETPQLLKQELLDNMPPPKGAVLDHIYRDEEAAKKKIQTPGYDLVIIDNLQSVRIFARKDEKDNSAQHEDADRFKVHAKKNNCAILVLYNTGKKEWTPESGRTLEEWLIEPYKSRGGSELEDRVDEVINLYPRGAKDKNNTPAMFTHVGIAKGRLGSKGHYYKVRWLEGMDYELADHRQLLGRSKQETLAEVARSLVPLGEEWEFGAIREALRIEPHSSDSKALRRGLEASVLPGGPFRRGSKGAYLRVR